MNIDLLSESYKIRILNETDIDKIFELCSHNPQFYEYFPPFVTKESIHQDMLTLPPGKTSDDKYYFGYFDGDQLIAVMDLIDGYPMPEIVYIGFFMVDSNIQGHGTGSLIIRELCKALREAGYAEIRLAWAVGNHQAEFFWKKNGFSETGRSHNTKGHAVITARKFLNQ